MEYRPSRVIPAACFTLAMLVLRTAAVAQIYNIDWLSVDSGGGFSAGGGYSVNGTIGQPDAGRRSGGTFTLDSGFWGILAAVQTPGVPSLRIVRTLTNSVVVAWPLASAGFSLQQNTTLGASNWSSVAIAPIVVGGENQVIISPPQGNRFYRLKYP